MMSMKKMNMKKMIAANKMCTYVAVTAMFTLAGMATAKCIINHCCCAEKLKCKAKKAFKAMENNILN